MKIVFRAGTYSIGALPLIQKLNLLVFGSIGSYVATTAIITLLTRPHQNPISIFGFLHSPETYIIAGLGLIALTVKWKLYGFPLFVMATNIVENPWEFYDPINAVQIIFILWGYVMTRPTFKNPAYVLVAILMNIPGGFPIFNWHHVAESTIFLVLLFNIKSLRSPLSLFKDWRQ